jgi:hypothetical protein
LISEFTGFGINLNEDNVKCSGPEGLRKYNVAKAKYNEIFTLAEAYRLTKKFDTFFFHAGGNTISGRC